MIRLLMQSGDKKINRWDIFYFEPYIVIDAARYTRKYLFSG